MAELPPLIAHLRADITQFRSEMAAATATAKAETGASAGALKGLETVGKVAFLGLAAGAIAGGVASVKMAGDFEQSTTRLITSAGETRANIDLVRKGMLDMAGQVGYSAMDLSKAMYIVESAGRHGADGLVVLRAAAEGAKTENADLAVVANAVTTVLQDYHLKAADAALVTSKLVAGVSVGKTTFQELTASLHSVLPLASAMHVSLADIVGALASMTSHGVSAQQATENMAHALQHLQTITAPQAKELALLGISTRKLADDLSTKGLTGALQEVSNAILQHLGADKTHIVLNMMDALNKLPPEVQKLGRAAIDGSLTMGEYTKAAKGLSVEAGGQAAQFATLLKATHGIGTDQKSGAQIMQTYAAALKAATGDSTSLNVALMLTGENAGYTNSAVQAVAGATTEAGNHVKGWDEIQKTFNQRLDRNRDSLGALAITIGTQLIPWVSAGLDMTANFADALKKGSPPAVILASVIGGGLAVAMSVYLTRLAIAIVQTAVHTAKVTAHAAAEVARTAVLLISAGALGAVTVARVALSAAETVGLLITQRGVAGTLAYLAAQVAIKVATVAWTVVQWALNVALTANPIGLVIVAVAALVTGVVFAYQHVGWFRDAVNTVWDALKRFASWIWSGLGPALKAIGDWAAQVSSSLSSISPFATHSPSLVQQVTEGTAIIADRYGDMAARIAGHARMARGELNALGVGSSISSYGGSSIATGSSSAGMSSATLGGGSGVPMDDTNEILQQLLQVQQATYALLNRSRGMNSQAYGRTVASPS